MPDSATIAVRLIPRASTDEIAGQRDGALLVRVTAPPVDGRANTALCRLLAKRAGVPASQVHVIRGATSRDKLVRIDGVSPANLPRALGV